MGEQQTCAASWPDDGQEIYQFEFICMQGEARKRATRHLATIIIIIISSTSVIDRLFAIFAEETFFRPNRESRKATKRKTGLTELALRLRGCVWLDSGWPSKIGGCRCRDRFWWVPHQRIGSAQTPASAESRKKAEGYWWSNAHKCKNKSATVLLLQSWDGASYTLLRRWPEIPRRRQTESFATSRCVFSGGSFAVGKVG